MGHKPPIASGILHGAHAIQHSLPLVMRFLQRVGGNKRCNYITLPALPTLPQY